MLAARCCTVGQTKLDLMIVYKKPTNPSLLSVRLRILRGGG